MGSNEDIEDSTDPLDDVRDAVAHLEVSSGPQTLSVIWPADGEYSLSCLHPACPVNYLLRHREPFSDAKG